MIRYIDIPAGDDLRDRSRFAFFNTVTDRFFTLHGAQAWESWDDFAQDWELQNDTFRQQRPLGDFERAMPKPDIIIEDDIGARLGRTGMKETDHE